MLKRKTKEDLKDSLGQLLHHIGQMRRQRLHYESVTPAASQARMLAGLQVENSLHYLCENGLDAIGAGPFSRLTGLCGEQPEAICVRINQGTGSVEQVDVPVPADENEALRIARGYLTLVEAGMHFVSNLEGTQPRATMDQELPVERLKARLREMRDKLDEKVEGAFARAMVAAAAYLFKGACEDLQQAGHLPAPPRIQPGVPIVIDLENLQRQSVCIPDSPADPSDLAPVGIQLGGVLGATGECQLAELALSLASL